MLYNKAERHIIKLLRVHFGHCALHFAERFISLTRARQAPPDKPTYKQRFRMHLVLQYLGVFINEKTLLNVDWYLGLSGATFASSMLRRAGASPPRNNRPLGWPKLTRVNFCHAAPPELKNDHLGGDSLLRGTRKTHYPHQTSLAVPHIGQTKSFE